MQINETSHNSILMMYKTVSEFPWAEAKAHILMSAKSIYDTSNSKLISFAGNPWWFYHLSQLHQFAGYHPSPFTLDMMTTWKPCGSDFVVPFIRLGNVALRSLSSLKFEFPKFSTNEADHTKLMKRFTKYAAKPHKMEGVNYGFLDASFFKILELCYVEELAKNIRLFAVPETTTLEDGSNLTWAQLFSKYKKRLYKMLRVWVNEQQDGAASNEQIELAKQVVNKMKWFMDGQILANGVSCPQMDTPTPFICPQFIVDVANDITLRQWAVLRVSLQF